MTRPGFEAAGIGYRLDLCTVPDEPRALIAEIRGLQVAAYRIMLGALDTAGRKAGMQHLLERARHGHCPELCCFAVERALLDAVFGRQPGAWYDEAMIEEAVAGQYAETAA